MELVNIGFAQLLIKIVLGVMPIVLGVYSLLLSEDSKRELRNKFCMAMFGVSGAIPYAKFSRAIMIIGALSIIFGSLLTWFLVLAPYFQE